MSNFHGILPAVVTPFDDGESFVPSAFEALLERVYSAGVHGVYVCGGTGEGLVQPVDQRKQVAEVAVKNSPKGKQVIVHIGSHRTADAVELARHASRIGASAISALPPLGGFPFPEIKRYYQTVAAASDVPLLVYFFPVLYPGIETAQQILELCALPNVAGLKYTDFDLYRLELIKRTGATVYNGRDEVLAAGLLMGADGGIGTFYNIIPELFVEVYRLALEGDWESARRVQYRINTAIEVVLRFPLFPAIKEILGWRGIDCGPCIAPRGPLEPGQAAELRRQFEAAGLA